MINLPVIRDISYCQSGFNGPGLKKRGVALMIRMGQGIWIDEDFWANYNAAIADEVMFGVWWFYQPNMAFGPQLAAFLALYNALPWKPPVIALDVENISYWTAEDENGEAIYDQDGTQMEILIDTYWSDEDENGETIFDQDGTQMQILINVLPPNPTIHTAWLLGWLRGVESATGYIPGIYTRQNYWNEWTLRGSGFNHFWLWVASWTIYSTNIAMPADWDTWVIWQDEGGTATDPDIPGPVDHDYFNGSQEQMNALFGGEVRIMGNAYSMDPALCARVITVTSADARSTVAPKDLGVSAMIIRAGGSNGPGMTVFQDVAWNARQLAAEDDGVPVVMWFELDPGWYPANDVDSGMVNDRSGHPDRQPVLLQLLRCLSKDPAASWATMSAPGFDGWRNVHGIMVSQYNDKYLGLDVGDFWVTLSISDIVIQLKALMDKGTIPVLPIILQTLPSLLAKYQEHLGTWLAYKPATANDGLARSSWLYLAYGGKEVWTLSESRSDMPSIADCWQWAFYNIAQNTYVWKYVPDGYADRILFHETTQNRLYTPAYTDSAGNARPATLSLSPRMTAAQLAEVLKVDAAPGGGGGGTETPPVDLTAVLTRLDAVDANAEANRRILMQELLSLRARVDGIFK